MRCVSFDALSFVPDARSFNRSGYLFALFRCLFFRFDNDTFISSNTEAVVAAAAADRSVEGLHKRRQRAPFPSLCPSTWDRCGV